MILALLIVVATEDVGGSFSKFPLPLADLGRVNLKPFCQFGNCLLAFQRFQCHPGFEYRAVLPATLFQCPAPSSFFAILGAEPALNNLSSFWGPPQWTHGGRVVSSSQRLSVGCLLSVRHHW